MTKKHLKNSSGFLELPPKLRPLANQIDALYWAEDTIKSVDGRPFSLDHFPALVQFYQDDSKQVVAQKSAQIGLSIASSIRFLHKVAIRKIRGIYYFPTDELRNTFVQSRFNPLINDNPEAAKLATSIDNVGVKQFGKQFAYFFGMKGITTKHSTPAGCLVFDELDRMGDKEVEVAHKRMENSLDREVDYLSTPTVFNYGVNRYFQQSDQKYLALECSGCGRRSIAEELEFPNCIENGFLSCPHCGKSLNPWAWEWVPKITQVQMDYSGYSFCRLCSPTADYKRLYKEFKRAINIADYYNQVLGKPYEDAETSVSEAFVLSLCGPTLMPTSNPKVECTMGVDIGMASGKGKHVCISRPGKSRPREIVWLGTIDRIGKLAEIIIRYGVKRFVIDAGPQRDEVEDFVKRYKSKGWMCVYNESQKASFTWNDETQIVSVNRTQSLDASQRALREQMIELPRRCETVEDFAAHCASLARVNDQDEETGIIKPRWIHRGPDDYRHAFNYDCLNWMDYGSGNKVAKSIIKIAASELYRTPIRNGKLKLGWT